MLEAGDARSARLEVRRSTDCSASLTATRTDGSTCLWHSSAQSLSAGRSIVIVLFGSCSCPHSLGAARHQLSCAKPQIESRAETTRATHDTFMDMLFGPMTTDHRPIILTRCMTANIAKSNAETDPHRKAHQGVEMAIRIARGL